MKTYVDALLIAKDFAVQFDDIFIIGQKYINGFQPFDVLMKKFGTALN